MGDFPQKVGECFNNYFIKTLSSTWWDTFLVPAYRWQRQVDVSEFKDSLVYITSSRPAMFIVRLSQTNIKVNGKGPIMPEILTDVT